MRHPLVFLIFGILPLCTLHAERYQFTLRHGETALQGGAVCFFPGGRDSFADQYFRSNDVRCVAADQLLTIPPGGWNVFAVHPDGFVGTHPDHFLVPPHLPDKIDRTPLSLVRAGTLDVTKAREQLREGEYIGIYIHNDGRPRSPATFRPIPDDATAVLVPADMPLLPFIIDGGSIAAVGEPLTVSSDATVVLPPFARSSEGTHVVVELVLEDAWRRRAADLRETPTARLETAAGEQLQPLLPLRPREQWAGSLVIFRNVPRGKAVLRVGGTYWQRIEALLEVKHQAVHLFHPPLALAAAGALSVGWQGLDRASDALLQRTRCDETPTDATPAEPPRLHLVRCGSWPPTTPADCVVYAEETLEGVAGTTLFSGVAPGDYVLELQDQHATVSRRVTIEALTTAEQHFDLRRSVLRGRITRGGAPIKAVVRVGDAGRAVSDAATGDYAAPIDGPIEGVTVFVQPCGADRTYRTLGPASLGEPFDIELPENTVHVMVTDITSGKPVGAAAVTYAIAPAADRGTTYHEKAVTNAEGVLSLEGVSTSGFVEICADKEGYVRACHPRFQLGAREQKDVRLGLAPIQAREGRLVGPQDVQGGRIYFVTNPGIILASARIERDGRFTYELPPSLAAVHVVVFGRNIPLFASAYEAPADTQPLLLPVPAAPVRSITVSKLAAPAPVPFTIIIGGLTVPRVVLDQHQLARDRESRVMPGRPVTVPDVLLTGPAHVVMGPDVMPPDFPRPTSPYVDIFNTPGFAQTLRVLPVGPDGAVVFP